MNKFEGMEDKFFVINKKRLEELAQAGGIEYCRMFVAAVESFNAAYEKHVKRAMNQKYVVVNQDEPYADKVWGLIRGYNLLRDLQNRNKGGSKDGMD